MPAPKQDEEAKARVKLLLLAYARVFGVDRARRDPAQRLVWADMMKRGYLQRTTMVSDAKGEVCALRMAQAEGCRIFLLQIEEFIERASAVDELTPKSPKARTE